jgi:hypothetical protein
VANKLQKLYPGDVLRFSGDGELNSVWDSGTFLAGYRMNVLLKKIDVDTRGE